MSSISETWGPLLESVSFAARAHENHLRKDGKTPYVAHVFRVCLILRQVFDITDETVLRAALLHDTIEDTRTDYDDLLDLPGKDVETVAQHVALLSKDTRMPDIPREEAYRMALSKAPVAVRFCKLADLFDNLMDLSHLPEKAQKRSLKRADTTLTMLEKAGLQKKDVKYREQYQGICRLVRELWTERNGSLTTSGRTE